MTRGRSGLQHLRGTGSTRMVNGLGIARVGVGGIGRRPMLGRPISYDPAGRGFQVRPAVRRVATDVVLTPSPRCCASTASSAKLVEFWRGGEAGVPLANPRHPGQLRG